MPGWDGADAFLHRAGVDILALRIAPIAMLQCRLDRSRSGLWTGFIFRPPLDCAQGLPAVCWCPAATTRCRPRRSRRLASMRPIFLEGRCPIRGSNRLDIELVSVSAVAHTNDLIVDRIDIPLIVARTDAIAVEGLDAALDAAPPPISRRVPACRLSRHRHRKMRYAPCARALAVAYRCLPTW